MGSKKVILILGLVSMVLMISSEVAARDLAEVSSNPKEEVVEETNEVGDAKYGGSYPGHGGNGGSYPGHGGHGGCRYGCCGRGYHGGCRCCFYAGEAVAVETQDKTRN